MKKSSSKTRSRGCPVCNDDGLPDTFCPVCGKWDIRSPDEYDDEADETLVI